MTLIKLVSRSSLYFELAIQLRNGLAGRVQLPRLWRKLLLSNQLRDDLALGTEKDTVMTISGRIFA